MPDRVISVPQATQIATKIKNKFDNINGRLAQETERAKGEEERIEALFTAPTQEAVDAWLSEHPEATTTVQDGSITKQKLDSRLRNLVFSPDEFEGTDSQKIQAALDALKDTGGVIQIDRIYTLSDNIENTFNTDNVDYMHAFITIIGVAKNAGINFNTYCIDGKNKSGYGGLRFVNLDLFGTEYGFINLNGLIRVRFKNCRIYGFKRLMSGGLIQDVAIHDCHITDVSEAIVYCDYLIYSLRIINNTIEHCGSVIYDDGTHSWMGVYVDYNLIENMSVPAVITGRGASVVSVCKNYFEAINNVIVDFSHLMDNQANAIGVTFNDNAIIGRENSSYPSVKLPKTDKFNKSFGDEICHGTIENNSGRGILIGSEIASGDNPLRWIVCNNSTLFTYDKAILYDYPAANVSTYTATLSATTTETIEDKVTEVINSIVSQGIYTGYQSYTNLEGGYSAFVVKTRNVGTRCSIFGALIAPKYARYHWFSAVIDTTLNTILNVAVADELNALQTPQSTVIECYAVGVKLSGVLQFLTIVPEYISNNYDISVSKIVIQGIKSIDTNISITGIKTASLICKTTDETSLDYVGQVASVYLNVNKIREL